MKNVLNYFLRIGISLAGSLLVNALLPAAATPQVPTSTHAPAAASCAPSVVALPSTSSASHVPPAPAFASAPTFVVTEPLLDPAHARVERPPRG